MSGRRGEAGELREQVLERFGHEGLEELGLAIASAQFFPTMKRATGFARSCATVEVEV